MWRGSILLDSRRCALSARCTGLSQDVDQRRGALRVLSPETVLDAPGRSQSRGTIGAMPCRPAEGEYSRPPGACVVRQGFRVGGRASPEGRSPIILRAMNVPIASKPATDRLLSSAAYL